MPVKYNVISPRDITQQNQEKLDTKTDKRQSFKAVIVDVLGNQSGSGDIWADQATRRLWIMKLGSTVPQPVLCVRIPNPVIGLGCIVGYIDHLSNTLEVLRTDYEFYQPTNTTGQSWEAPDYTDFLPGGHQQLWIASKLIEPLATYPNNAGLFVNVVAGDYPYDGTRKTYGGQTNINLSSAQPSAGQYRLVGLYLDSANTLQTINGTAGASPIPAEPSWPTGAFRLSAVRLYNPQVKINLERDNEATNDIFDRRMVWSDENGGGWPFDKIVSVSATNGLADFTTIQGANDGTTGPAVIIPDPATYTETLTLNKTQVGLVSFGTRSEVVVTSADATTLTIGAASVAGRFLTVKNTNAGATAKCIFTDQESSIFDALRILKVSGAALSSIGIHIAGGTDGTLIRDCAIYVSSGTSKYGILIDTASSLVIMDGGEIEGGTFDIRLNDSGAVLRLQNDVKFLGGGIQVVAGQIQSNEPIATTITGPYTANSSLNGKNPTESIIISNQNTTDTTFTPNASNLHFANWKISNTGAGDGGISHTVVTNAQSGLVLDGVVIEKITGAATTCIGFSSTAGDTLLRNCKINVSAGTGVNYAVYQVTAGSTVIIEGGEILAGQLVTSHASAVLELKGVKLASGVTFDTSGGGIIKGWYLDANGHVIVLNGSHVVMPALVNGELLVWQRGTSFAAIANNAFSADMWRYNVVGAAVHTVSQASDVPTVAQAGRKLNYSLLVDCTTADASIAAGDYTYVRTCLEGFDWIDYAQVGFPFSFWHKHTKTGTYCVAFRNSGADRSFVAEYSQAVTDTWELATVWVEPSPTGGTWDYTNGIGLEIRFALSCGSTFQTTAGAWQTGDYFGTSNQVNATDSTSNNFMLALVGNVPDGDVEHKKARCQRYAFVLPATGNLGFSGVKSATTNVWAYAKFPTTMRATPTLSHNVTGWTSAGLPTGTTIGAYDFTANIYLTITGALTFSMYAGSPEDVWLLAQAATSFNGTNGDLTALNLGTGVIAVLSADL